MAGEGSIIQQFLAQKLALEQLHEIAVLLEQPKMDELCQEIATKLVRDPDSARAVVRAGTLIAELTEQLMQFCAVSMAEEARDDA